MGGFDDDDFFAGSNGNDGFGEFAAEEEAPRRPRQRRASISAGSGPSSRRSGSSDRSGTSSSNSSSSRPSSRRPPSATHSSQSLDDQLESVPASSSRSTDRSVASSGSSAPRARTSRRASVSGSVPSSTRVSSRVPREEVDYGYGSDDTGSQGGPSYEDFGYGDAEPSSAAPPPPAPSAEPARARRQRRCSIADVVNTASIQPTSSSNNSCGGDYGYGDATPDSCPAPASRGLTAPGGVAPSSRRVGALTGASMANMAIPMADSEPKKGGMGRRGSIAMIANIGRPKKEEKVVEVAAKKPGADRDRQRQGTLLDRVGASSAEKSGRGATGSSYSDRIMSK